MIKLQNVNKKLILLAVLLCFGAALNGQTHYVMIETNMGNMKVMLYDDTPKTTANFLKKVKEGYYNETLFGRVIQSFMIQGGAPDSRNAGPGWSLGYGDIDEEIEGEIRPNHIPKKGALAAPHREHMKNSDMSMFFIVQGYVQSKEYWRGWEKVNNEAARKAAKKKVMTQAVKDSLVALKPGDFAPNAERERYNNFVRKVNHQIDSIARATPGTRFFTDDEIEAYSTIGGAYHLYMDYTIYGEVVEGLEVIDKIAELETNSADRPRKDVRMNIRIIK
ncbi:MAG: peptidylprolyl isomerase [Bacteroidales bacterium]|nr:peptidylprolyl isomerase [Bacteroidales bacterium]MBO7378812.1 peptidylprolyl isomerase [Bacteroidales bacterium]MBP5213883.1 peptidylprolyl isomerase [Bacteroidales bacterium]MBP5765114.1 peptidylprolyl isomerase [Bacteroidales bacterium]